MTLFQVLASERDRRRRRPSPLFCSTMCTVCAALNVDGGGESGKLSFEGGFVRSAPARSHGGEEGIDSENGAGIDKQSMFRSSIKAHRIRRSLKGFFPLLFHFSIAAIF